MSATCLFACLFDRVASSWLQFSFSSKFSHSLCLAFYINRCTPSRSSWNSSLFLLLPWAHFPLSTAAGAKLAIIYPHPKLKRKQPRVCFSATEAASQQPPWHAVFSDGWPRTCVFPKTTSESKFLSKSYKFSKSSKGGSSCPCFSDCFSGSLVLEISESGVGCSQIANPDGFKSCFDTCDHVQAQQSSNHFVSYGWE